MFIRFLRNSPLSSLALFLITALLCFHSYKVGTWRTNRSIVHDITSYYSYLPAAFIYHDFQFSYRFDLPENEPLDHLWVNTKGDTVFQKMSIGLSYFYLPTFLAAHAYTLQQDQYNANGFSRPYQMAMNINTLFFGLLGLLVICLLARYLFDDLSAAISMVLLYAGTNLLHYISGDPGFSHPYGFLLVALIFLLSLYYFDRPSLLIFSLLSAILGLAVLVRPTNLILCLFPLLYGLNKKHRPELRRILRSPKHYLIFIALFLIPWIPQLIYWKYATGHWIYYSYDQEGFFFLKPHVWDGLFSYRKGWLVYTPLMLFAIIGLVLGKQWKTLRWPLFIILPLFSYVVFSWWCWWYGGSFGSRVMIETYPLLLLGLGSFVQFILKQKWFWRIPLTVLLGFCLLLNLHQSWQTAIGMLHWDSMSKSSYWSIFMKNKPPSNFQELLEAPDYQKAMIEGE